MIFFKFIYSQIGTSTEPSSDDDQQEVRSFEMEIFGTPRRHKYILRYRTPRGEQTQIFVFSNIVMPENLVPACINYFRYTFYRLAGTSFIAD